MKKLAQQTLLAAFTAFLFTSCMQPAAEKPMAINMDSLKMEIQKMEDAFSAAEKDKNADGVVEYYSDDAISYARNHEPLTGKTAIRDYIAESIAKDTTGSYFVYKIVDLFADGNHAVEIGAWTKHNAAGDAVENGNYLSYFEKRDGKYVCVRDMATTTAPVKTGM